MISFVRPRAGVISHRFIINVSTMQHSYNNPSSIFTLALLQWACQWKDLGVAWTTNTGEKVQPLTWVFAHSCFTPILYLSLSLLLLVLPKTSQVGHLHGLVFITMSTTPIGLGFLNNITIWTALLEVKHAHTNWESGSFWALKSDYRHCYTHTNSHQGETQVHAAPCISPPCPSPTTWEWCGRDGTMGVMLPCLCPGMAQRAPAPQLNAGQESFPSCLTAYLFQIHFFCGWRAVMSWEMSSPIRGLGRKRPFFSGNDGVQRDCGQVTQWLIACKIHLCLTGAFQEQLWTISKAWSTAKSTWSSIVRTPVIEGTGLRVIKSLWHFDFYLGFSLQRVGTWSCSIQADSQVHALLWRE